MELNLSKFFSETLQLIYPNSCLFCDNTLTTKEEYICTACFQLLEPTDFHLYADNFVARKFYGRVPIYWAMSCFPFIKKGNTQAILHNLKYRGEDSISEIIGKWYGLILKNSKLHHFDLILPVPLHSKKLAKRGYNQSDGFAKGIAISMDTPWNNTLIRRTTMTETQTKKSRFQRWKNVENVFEVTLPELVANKHVLLVDDVVTTGATLEACTKMLLQAECSKVSIATIAYT